MPDWFTVWRIVSAKNTDLKATTLYKARPTDFVEIGIPETDSDKIFDRLVMEKLLDFVRSYIKQDPDITIAQIKTYLISMHECTQSLCEETMDIIFSEMQIQASSPNQTFRECMENSPGAVPMSGHMLPSPTSDSSDSSDEQKSDPPKKSQVEMTPRKGNELRRDGQMVTVLQGRGSIGGSLLGAQQPKVGTPNGEYKVFFHNQPEPGNHGRKKSQQLIDRLKGAAQNTEDLCGK